MSWYAKPSGGYALSSNEGRSNCLEIANYLATKGYTQEAQAAVVGNVMAESALNPWRWQSDRVNYSAGYGLFQYTPARDYINGMTGVAEYAPNLSVSETTSGANPRDGAAQCVVMADNLLSKWVGTCWRSYWSSVSYPELYALRERILQVWGNGSSLTMAQFARINDIEAATFAFLACFEGSAVPNNSVRVQNANQAYSVITGSTPPGDVITITATLDGQISWMYSFTGGTFTYNPGDTVYMECIPYSGYSFLGWYENGQLVSMEERYTFTATVNRNLVGVVQPSEYRTPWLLKCIADNSVKKKYFY